MASSSSSCCHFLLFLTLLITLGTGFLFYTFTSVKVTYYDGAGNIETDPYPNGASHCDLIDTAVKISTTYPDGGEQVILCPWVEGVLVLGYVALVCTLGVILFVVLRCCFNSGRFFKITFLVGVIAIIFLVLDLLWMIHTYKDPSVEDDYSDAHGVTSVFSIPTFGQMALICLLVILVLGLLFNEARSYKSDNRVRDEKILPLKGTKKKQLETLRGGSVNS